MKPSRAFIILSIILSLALVGVLLAPQVAACCPCWWCLWYCCNNRVPEFTPATAAIAVAGIAGIAYLLRRRLAKAH